MKFDANFDNSASTQGAALVYDPGRGNGSPVSPLMSGRAWGVLVCGDVITDALFDYDTAAFYRLNGFLANSEFKGRRYTFQVNDPKTVTITVEASFFTPFITVQRTVGMVKQGVGAVEFEVTEETSGEYAIEVSSVEKHKTGPFVISVICETTTELCGIPTTLGPVTLRPLEYEFYFEATAEQLWLVAVKESIDLGVSLVVDGIDILDWDYFSDLGIWHFWFRASNGRNNCGLTALATGLATIKHWGFKLATGYFGVADPREEESQSEPGIQCLVESRTWAANDVYMILPHAYSVLGVIHTVRINIINTTTSTVVATSQDGIFIVPASATYRIELLQESDLGLNLSAAGMDYDCWLKAAITVDPTSGASELAVTGTNTSLKKSTLAWGATAWRCMREDAELIEELLQNDIQNYAVTLNSCTGNEVYKLRMSIRDEDYRADELDYTTITVAANSVSATPITFDATFVAFVNAHKTWFMFPGGEGEWDGTLPRFESLNGDPLGLPYYGYAVDDQEGSGSPLFIVRKVCDEYRGLQGFMWEFYFYYGNTYDMRYSKVVYSNTAAGVYSLDAWVEDPALPGLPATITIS